MEILQLLVIMSTITTSDGKINAEVRFMFY